MSGNESQKRVFITWDDHGSRARSLASDLNANNYYIQNINTRSKFLAPFKYFSNALETWNVLKKEKPEIIFIVSPPIFAVLTVWIYNLFYTCAYVVDAHCGTFLAKRWSMFLWLYRFLSKKALLNILHNEPLEKRVTGWGAPAINLGDIFYQVQTNQAYPFRKGFNIVFVSVFAADEPLEEVIETARRLPSVNFYITGSLARAPKGIVQESPQNVVFTDFLPDEDYNALLKGSDIVVSLTKADFTMQNAVYEAIALGRPIITSDWPVLRKIYYKGTLWIDNSTPSLINAIQAIQNDYSRCLMEVKELKNEFLSSWEEKRKKLLELLDHWKDPIN